MKRTQTTPDLSQFPEEFRYLLENRPVYDSSCSEEAKVWFLDQDGGLFLKSAPGGRHFDIFWGAWTLLFNLKTNAYCDRFLDAYGRDCIQPELLKTIAALEGFTE